MNRLDEALQIELKVLKYKKTHKISEKSIATTYSSLCTIQKKLGNIKLAIEYQKSALEIREKYPNELNQLFISYKLLGNLYDITNDDAQAIRLYGLALKTLYRISNDANHEKFKCHVNLYYVLKRNNNIKSGVQKEKAIKILHDLYIDEKDEIDWQSEFHKVREKLLDSQ